MSISRVLATFFACVFLTACGEQSAASDISAKSVWIRPATKTTNTAVYMILENKGGADKLVEISTDLSKISMVHQTKNNNGVLSMEMIHSGLEIPANGSVELKPGGFHVMIENINRDLVEGETIDLTLKFGSGKTMNVKAQVKLNP
jgi:copper(I)-binding protein